MKQLKSQQGFTLVELAIVMTIIGLLIGGILKGQELMENARVTSTIAQIRAYEAAVTTFRDTYGALPGDMVGADVRITNADVANDATLGDNSVGAVGGIETAQATATSESTLFWQHLALTNMITGVAPTSTVIGWGTSHPEARVGGGFHAKDGDGSTNTVFASGSEPVGLNIVLQADATADLNQTAGAQVLMPLRAAQMDRRMDDGQSQTGTVRGYGVDASCAQGGVNADSYSEIVEDEDCGLAFAIAG